MDEIVRDALKIFHAAVRRVQTDQLTWPTIVWDCLNQVRKNGGVIRVLAAGKAAIGMASSLERALEGALTAGLAVVPHGYIDALPGHLSLPKRIDVTEAGHPVPDARGLDAALRAIEIAKSCGPADVLLVLLSGGASALLPAPAANLTLDHLAAANRALLACGADICQINTLRKHLSRLKGGRLATLAWPARTVTLAISDVPGDDLSVIGSGPTVADATTFADCLGIIESLRVDLPKEVTAHLARGAEGRVSETPEPGDKQLARTRSIVVASNGLAITAAASEARSLGYGVAGIEQNVTGEARTIGVERAREARHMGLGQCFLWGGESTVIVRGDGRGGRNQELVLAAVSELDGLSNHMVVLSGGTDGIDGPTDAAGAWATPATLAKGRTIGLDAELALNRNDAYTYFDAIDQLIRTGPTHTNVMDVGLALTGKPIAK